MTKITSITLSLLLLSGYLIFTSSSGGVTGNSTSGCGGGGCHTASSNTTMNVVGIPASGYVNGTTYTMTLSVSNVNKAKAGFDMTVNSGTLAAGAGSALNGTQELRHTSPGTAASGTTIWSFSWTAPATGSSPVIFFIAGNAVDGNNASSNDEFSTDQVTFNAASSIAAPTITGSTGAGLSSTTASISATVNPNGDPASVSIQYGLTTTYGSTSNATPSVVTGNTPNPISATLTSLLPNTLYHFRVVATNSVDVTNGPDGTFTTMPASINSIEKTSISIYPNPTSNIMLYVDKENNATASFQVVSLLGNKYDVSTSKISDGKYQLNLTSLVSGNYILLINRDGKMFYHSFVKQ